MKKIIKLTENELHKIIKESVKKTIKNLNERYEIGDKIGIYKAENSMGTYGKVIGKGILSDDRLASDAYEEYADELDINVDMPLALVKRDYAEEYQTCGLWYLFVPDNENDMAYWMHEEMDGVRIID